MLPCIRSRDPSFACGIAPASSSENTYSRWWPRLLPWLLVALTIVGCEKGGRKVVPVKGTVTIDGAPMTFGRVLFSPIASEGQMEAGKPAIGYIQSDGTFTLTTYKANDGAVTGNHRVIVSSKSRKKSDRSKPPWPDNVPRFENLRLVGQRFEVKQEGQNSIEIQLTSDQIRNFGEQE